MKLLCLSDSFKGSLSSAQIGALVQQAATRVWPEASTETIYIADGGEGTVDAVLSSAPGRRVSCTVSDPLGRPVSACYGVLNSGAVIMEMAAAAGLTLLTPAERDPLLTTTRGVGELLRDALDRGHRRIYLGIGGSATNDCGMGFLEALGVKFYDSDGRVLSGCGNAMGQVASVDFSGLDPRLAQCQLTVLCDVDNPLLGPDGAAYTFAAQKGGAGVLDRLEHNARHFSALINSCRQADNTAAGTGAAGGLGFCLLEVLHACRIRGIDAVLNITGAEEKIRQADLVITGEGCIDWQSTHGKAVWGVTQLCRKWNTPVIAFAGSLGRGAYDLYHDGVNAIIPISPGPCSLEDAMNRAAEHYLTAAEQVFRLLKLGTALPAYPNRQM